MDYLNIHGIYADVLSHKLHGSEYAETPVVISEEQPVNPEN